MKRILSLGILSTLLLVSLVGCDVTIAPIGSSTPTPAGTVISQPSPTATSGPASPTAQPTPTDTGTAMTNAITSVLTAYYNNVEARNYTQAYSYLDPQATDSTTGKMLTQSSFIQLAQSMDSEEGTVVSFNIGVFPPQTLVTMTMMRSHLGPYHAQLNMKQEDNTWKITSLDRI